MLEKELPCVRGRKIMQLFHGSLPRLHQDYADMILLPASPCLVTELVSNNPAETRSQISDSYRLEIFRPGNLTLMTTSIALCYGCVQSWKRGAGKVVVITEQMHLMRSLLASQLAVCWDNVTAVARVIVWHRILPLVVIAAAISPLKISLRKTASIISLH